MNWYGHDMGWWGYVGMGIGMVLFWALIVVGIIALIRFVTDSPQSEQALPSVAASPEEVLAARFARGEIKETEYRDRLAVLREHARPPF